MSKIIQIFLNCFFIEEYESIGMFFVFDIFWKFLRHFVYYNHAYFWLLDLERILIYEKVLFITQLSSHLMRKLLKQSEMLSMESLCQVDLKPKNWHCSDKPQTKFSSACRAQKWGLFFTSHQSKKALQDSRAANVVWQTTQRKAQI